MADFGLIKSFAIDNCELDGLRLQDAFVLGYELALVDSLLKFQHTPITQLVHAENRERVIASCKNAGRDYSVAWMENDPSEQWMLLSVAPLNGNAKSA